MKRKHIAAIVALVLLLCTAVGGTLAWLVAGPKEVVNTFDPAHVTCWVNEEFDGVTKKDVSIKNTSDIDAYIRVAVVANWVDQYGNVSGTTPVLGTDYKVTPPDGPSKWKSGADGYIYYIDPVEPGKDTGLLFKECAPVAGKAPQGYDLQLTILAEAIQSEPDHVVVDNWGSVTAVSENNVLTIQQPPVVQ